MIPFRRFRTCPAFVAVAILAAAACTRAPEVVTRPASDTERAGDVAPAATMPGFVSLPTGIGATPRLPALVTDVLGDSLHNPESVVWDGRSGEYLVSNVNGPSTAKDDNGFISRIDADGTMLDARFVAGGRDDVTLHAPKGLALVGDTLWVTDIDVVRGFDAVSGEPVSTVDLAPLGATFLNDIAAGPDGSLYVTDSGIRFTRQGLVEHSGRDRVFRIDVDGSPSVALESARLRMPNGIAWDGDTERFVIAPLGSDTIFAWMPGSSTLTPLAVGPGQYDGIAVLSGGRLLVSSQGTSAVHLFGPDGEHRKVIEGVPSPADFTFVASRNVVALPLLGVNRVEWWTLLE